MEIEQACTALAAVGAYFDGIGLHREPLVDIAFAEQVFIRLYDSQSKASAGNFQVSGYYDAGRRVIEVTSATSAARADRRPWGLAWGAEVAHSILLHEVAHLFSREALGETYADVAKPWLEYVAAAVQFDLMGPAFRARVLANYPRAVPFPFREQVNAMLYAFDPDEFSVRAYLDAEANGGRSYIARLLTGTAGFSTREILWQK
jgi:hypothetical protein